MARPGEDAPGPGATGRESRPPEASRTVLPDGGDPAGGSEAADADGHADPAGTAEDDPLRAALRAAERRQPWTVDAVRSVATDPAETKATAAICAGCEAPCEADEVCASVVAHEFGLFDEVGRERAFRLVESGMKRLRTRDAATIREEGDRRPSVFVSLSADAAEE